MPLIEDRDKKLISFLKDLSSDVWKFLLDKKGHKEALKWTTAHLVL